MIVGIVFDELLERARTVGAIFTQGCIWDNMKAERFTDKVCSDLTQGKRVLRKVPKRLLAAARFVHSRVACTLMVNFNQEGVV
jgi:hypothetical protein